MNEKSPIPSKEFWSVTGNCDVVDISWSGDLDDVYDERRCSSLYRLPPDRRRYRI
jgi:hypothetical protein